MELDQHISSGSPHSAAINLEKASAGVEIVSIESGRWSWSTGPIFSYRRIHNPVPGSAPFFASSSDLGQQGSLKRALRRYPERRFTMDANARAEAGTFSASPWGGIPSWKGT